MYISSIQHEKDSYRFMALQHYDRMRASDSFLMPKIQIQMGI